MPLTLRQRLESKPPVKRIRLRIKRLRQQRADAGVLGDCKGTPDDILWQAATQATSLAIEIDCQPRKPIRWVSLRSSYRAGHVRQCDGRHDRDSGGGGAQRGCGGIGLIPRSHTCDKTI
jgi:hypothetical protein